MKKLLVGAGVVGLLALALVVGVVGFSVVSTAFAQGPIPNQNGTPGAAGCHDSTAVLQLLGLTQQDLLTQRQAGKSLLDIAKAKGVDEAKLADALTQPISTMHGWMGQTYGNQSSVDQMTQSMRDWIAKDIRETKFGTMTDYRLGLGGNGTTNGMMGGVYGPGMMGGTFGPGMMGTNGSTGLGGMMGDWRR